MKKAFYLLILLVFIQVPVPVIADPVPTLIPISTPDLSAYPKDSQGRAYIDGQVLVHFTKKYLPLASEGEGKSLGYAYEKHLYFDGLVLKVPNGTVFENVEKLKN